MRNRTLITLLAAVLVVAGTAWYVTGERNRASEADFATRPLLPGIAARVNDVTAMSVETAKGSFRIERAGEYWIMPEKSGYRVKADIVRKNILGIAGLEIIDVRTARPDFYDRIHVSEPAKYVAPDEASKSEPGPMLVKLLDVKNEVVAAVIVGKSKLREQGGKPAEMHVRLPGDAQAWLARGRVDLPAAAVGWLDKDMLRIERVRVGAASVRHPDGSSLQLVRTDGANDTAKDDFRPAAIPVGKKIASQYDVNALPGALAFPNFDDVARAAAHDFSKATVSVIETRDGIRVTVRTIPAADKKVWATFHVEFDAALVKAGGGEGLLSDEAARKQAEEAASRLNGWSYLMPEHTGRDLTRRLSDLLEDDKPKADTKG